VIPDFEPTTGALPLGRYSCTIAEVEGRLVQGPGFTGSATRAAVFSDWQTAKGMLDGISPDLIECAWLGGSFVTNKQDPDDMDSLFVLAGKAFEGLASNGLRRRVLEFNKKGRLREKTGLRVEPFIFVRKPHPMPFSRGGVDPACAEEFALRGAWDDWWQRIRVVKKDEPPTIEEAEPVRGYLEVRW
jgi:hypothetical protein